MLFVICALCLLALGIGAVTGISAFIFIGLGLLLIGSLALDWVG